MREGFFLVVILSLFCTAGYGDTGSADTKQQSTSSGQWQALGLSGGYVYDVAQSPTRPYVVLAATDGSIQGSSIYRSTDGGETWNPVPGPNETAFQLAFSRSSSIVFAASTSGIWRSDYWGSNFYLLPLNGFGFRSIAVAPANDSIVWLARESYPWIQKSTNGGSQWQTANPPNNTNSCQSIAIDPANSDRVLASCDSSLWLTVDGGQNWINRSSSLGLEVQDIEFTADRILVVAQGLVFASTTSGRTWAPVFDSNHVQRQATAQDLAIDPNNPSVMLIAEAEGGLHRTTDGGQSWQLAVAGSSGHAFGAVRFGPDQSDRIYVGSTSTGVYRSLDGGQTLHRSSHGIRQANVVDLAVNEQNPDELAAACATVGGGAIFTSLDGGQSWQLEDLPQGRWWMVRFAHGRLYALTNGPDALTPAGIYRRDSNGIWTAGGTELPLWTGTGFRGEIRIAADDPELILVSGFKIGGLAPVIWRSADGGDHWAEVYQGPTDTVEIPEIEILTDGQDPVILATVHGNPGTVARSTDRGITWEESRNGIDSQANPFSMCASVGSPQSVYLIDDGFYSGQNSLYRSTDGGQTWSRQSNPGNGAGGHWSIACDPGQEGTLYVSERYSNVVERSIDHGQSFSDFAQGQDVFDSPSRIYGVGAPNLKVYVASFTGLYVRDMGTVLFADGFESGDTGAWK